MSSLGPEARPRRGLSRTFQDAHLYPGLTVIETVMAATDARLRGGAVSAMTGSPWSRMSERDQRASAEAVLAAFGLERSRRDAGRRALHRDAEGVRPRRRRRRRSRRRAARRADGRARPARGGGAGPAPARPPRPARRVRARGRARHAAADVALRPHLLPGVRPGHRRGDTRRGARRPPRGRQLPRQRSGGRRAIRPQAQAKAEQGRRPQGQGECMAAGRRRCASGRVGRRGTTACVTAVALLVAVGVLVASVALRPDSLATAAVDSSGGSSAPAPRRSTADRGARRAPAAVRLAAGGAPGGERRCERPEPSEGRRRGAGSGVVDARRPRIVASPPTR